MVKKSSFSSNPWLIPSLLFIFGLALRVALLSKGPYHVDCLDLALTAEKTLTTQKLQFMYGFGYPFIVILSAFFISVGKLFGTLDPVTQVNLMSAFFGSLCIPACYELNKRIFDNLSALLSSIILCFFPVFWSLSTFGTSHTPAIFFLLSGLTFLAEHKKTGRKPLVWLASIAFGLLGACRFQDLILVMIPIVFFYFFKSPQEAPSDKNPKSFLEEFQKFLIFAGLIALVTLIFHLPLFVNNPGYKHQFGNYYQTGFVMSFEGFWSPPFWRSLRIIAQELTPLGIISSLGGLALLRREKSNLFFVFLPWILIPFLFLSVLSLVTHRLLALLFLPLIFSSGYFFASIIRQTKSWIKIMVCVLFVIGNIQNAATILPLLAHRHREAVLPDFARWIGTHTEPKAIIISGDEGTFINYYGKRRTKGWPEMSAASAPEFGVFKSWLNHELTKGTPVYCRLAKPYDFIYNKIVIDFLQKDYRLKYIGQAFFEDWHHSLTRFDAGWVRLYKIDFRNLGTEAPQAR